MLGRMGRQDFVEVIGRVLEEDCGPYPFKWHVYESYELIGSDRERAYFRAADGAAVRKVYEPLTDTPYLFLEFARLPEQQDKESAVWDWIAKYGLLGLELTDEPIPPESWPSHLGPWSYFRGDRPWSWGPINPPEYDWQGGPGEALTLFESEVLHAHIALSWWEASLSGDRDRLEQALFRGPPSRERMKALLDAINARAPKGEAAYVDLLARFAASGACLVVQVALEAFSYPFLSFHPITSKQKRSGEDSDKRFSRSWRPRNLLGAMYLQMYWLMTSSGEVVRCEKCDRPLPLTSPHPEGRKPRSDKRFCNDACRIAHKREKDKLERQSS